MSNETIKHQLNHRSIRAFKDQTLTSSQLNILYEVARHTSTSMFLQQVSILHLTEQNKRAQVRAITGQPYVGANGDLLIFLVDLYRNQQIRQRMGNDDGRLHTVDIFMQGVEDATLAVQNTLVAAESMGLGGVILGSINDNPQKLVQILELPPMTFPILGLQVGVPDQDPQLKPRLPLKQMVFENHYPTEFDYHNLADYDQLVHQYYDLRNTNRRVDTFSNQINSTKLNQHVTKRDQIVTTLHQQGLALDLN